MPGMMDTVLNLGLNDEAVEALAKKSGNNRFAWDSYRRFVQMYGDVVLGMKPESKEDIDPFEEIMDQLKEQKGIKKLNLPMPSISNDLSHTNTANNSHYIKPQPKTLIYSYDIDEDTQEKNTTIKK